MNIIKGLGYNLEAGVKYFDGIYTGTETREPFNNAQHLQQYQGYLIVRYLENADPGRNGGGWVDTGGMRYADRYAEQLWLTLFAKAPEITLFDLRQVQRLMQPSDRGAWQDLHPSFDFDQMMASAQLRRRHLGGARHDFPRGGIHLRSGGCLPWPARPAGWFEKLQARQFGRRGLHPQLPGHGWHSV